MRTSRIHGLLMGSALMASSIAILVHQGAFPRVLAASEPIDEDFDRDGLTTRQEAALGTSPWIADTDGDGWLDSEEVAYRTSPWVASEFPVTTAPSNQVGLYARGQDGSTVITLVVSTTDGDLEARNLTLEVLRPGASRTLDATRLLLSAQHRSAALAPGRHVDVFDLAIPEFFVQASGGLALGASIGPGGGMAADTRATLDLNLAAGITSPVVLARRTSPLLPPANLQAGQVTPGGSVHDPIPAGGTGDLPGSWLSGKVCYQRLETVGVSPSGLTVIKEVVEAYCDGNWNSWCDADCPGTVGTTIEVLDPAALIGG